MPYGLDPRFDPRLQGTAAIPGAPQPMMPPQLGGPPPVAGMPGAPGAPPGGPPPGTQGPGAPVDFQGPPGGAPAGGGGLDPHMVNAVLALQGQDSQRSSIDKQYALADQLRADAKDQTKGYKGQGWGNVAAGIAQNFAANRATKRGDEAGLALDKQTQSASREWMDALTGKKKKDIFPTTTGIDGGD
jgi:hypothetical protein